MALLSAPRSVELWVQWGALSQRHHRPLITDITITGITATTVTDNTRVTTDGDIIVLTAAKPSEAPRRLGKCALVEVLRSGICQMRGWRSAEVLGIRGRQSVGLARPPAAKYLHEDQGERG